MSGQTSNLGRVERIDPDSMAADNPVSTARAWICRNNLAHLTDQYAQHRINWVAYGPDSGGYRPVIGGFVALTPESAPWRQRFLHSWLKPDRPANLDILLSLEKNPTSDLTLSPDYTLHVRIEIAALSVAPDAVIAAFDFDVNTSALTAGNGTFQTFLSFDGSTAPFGSEIANPVTILNGSDFEYPLIMQAEFRITLSSTDATGSNRLFPFQLRQLLVREYA